MRIPFTNISPSTELKALIGMLNMNFQATQTTLAEKASVRRVSVTGYAATGATTTPIKLNASSASPWGVLLVRARATNDPGSDLSVSGRLNFTQSDGALYVFEPSGLTGNTLYDFEFLILE